MIFASIINLLLSVANWLLGLLPTVSLPSVSTFTAAVTSSGVFSYVAWANWYFPIDTLVVLVGLRFGWVVAEAGWRLVLWVLTVTHIAGGSGS